MKLIKPEILKHKRVLFVLITVFALLIIALSQTNKTGTGFVPIPVEPEIINPNEMKIRDECFQKISLITEKEAERFSQFRSLADYRLLRLRECLNENGIKE